MKQNLSPYYDVIVIGVGAMGSSTLYHLSKVPNLKVLGIDQFYPPHTNGSSHGETRITRQIYFEHPSYVPMIKKSYPMWRKLESETNTQLFVQTGGIYIGENEGILMKGTIKTAKEHNFEIKILKAKEIMERFPAYHVPENFVGIYDPTAGILFPEKCVESFISEARKSGAQLNFGEKVINIQSSPNYETVVTDKGNYYAKKLIISAGAYVTSLLKDEKLPLKVEKKKIFWMEPVKGFKEDFTPEKFPIFLIADDKTNIILYGFPNILGTGVKSAMHVNKADYVQDVYNIDRTIEEKDLKEFKERISLYLPKVFGKLNKLSTCLYTMAADDNFVIDFLPRNKNIILASPCSGHGFKFSVIIGEILKDLALYGKSEFDLSLFNIKRLFENNSKL